MSFMPALRIGDLAARLPIIQGGMGVGVSGVCLASAVANEGGIGVLSSAGMGIDTPGYRADPIGVSIQTLKGEIQKARELTNGILGVNIMVATSNFADMAKAAIEGEIDLIFAGAGLPLDPAQTSDRRRENKAGSYRILRKSRGHDTKTLDIQISVYS